PSKSENVLDSIYTDRPQSLKNAISVDQGETLELLYEIGLDHEWAEAIEFGTEEHIISAKNTFGSFGSMAAKKYFRQQPKKREEIYRKYNYSPDEKVAKYISSGEFREPTEDAIIKEIRGEGPAFDLYNTRTRELRLYNKNIEKMNKQRFYSDLGYKIPESLRFESEKKIKSYYKQRVLSHELSHHLQTFVEEKEKRINKYAEEREAQLVEQYTSDLFEDYVSRGEPIGKLHITPFTAPQGVKPRQSSYYDRSRARYLQEVHHPGARPMYIITDTIKYISDNFYSWFDLMLTRNGWSR
ncbi:MAG: hypothetical protein ACTSPI_18140, partial [Candidatus Heimdallarchaeaceae archaeon]